MVKFAATYANASLEDKNDEFRDLVGFYDDIDQYNSLGRVQDPDGPYLEDNATNHWRWQSESEQSTYRHLKNRSREAFRRADFMIGLVVVNRIVSIIDAIRDAKRANSKLRDSEFSLVGDINYRLEVNPFDFDKPIKFALVARF